MASFQVGPISSGGGGGLGGFFGGIVSGTQRALTSIRRELDLPPITVKTAVDAAKDRIGQATVSTVVNWFKGGGAVAGNTAGNAIAAQGEQVAGRIAQAKAGGAIYDVATSPLLLLALGAAGFFFLGSRRR